MNKNPMTETTITNLNPKTQTPTRRSIINKKDSVISTYDAGYNILKRLNNMTLSHSMNRIPTNGSIQIFLEKRGLIKEVALENNHREEYLTFRYYSISIKGQGYIK
jgi:hypothetical protein